MKKLLKLFAVPAILACGLLIGCNNGGMDLDLNVTVSTQAPSLGDLQNLGYGVLLTWNYTQDGNQFRVTRQKKGGIVVELYEGACNYCFDAAALGNEFEADVEYTYRVYNLGNKSNDRGEAIANYNDGYVVYESYAERRITLKTEDIKAQNEMLPKIDAKKVNYTFKNGILKIAFSDDFDRLVDKNFVVTNKATSRKIQNVSLDRDSGSNVWSGCVGEDVEEISVAITNVDENDYYADSEAETIPSIKNSKDADLVTISSFSATLRDNTVVLLWTTTGKEDVAATDFTIQRKGNAADDKYETLTITPTSQTKYDGTKYWTATDSTIEVGKSYIYKLITDDGSRSDFVNTKTFIYLASARYNKDTNTVTLQWNASTDISEFIIYRAEENLSGEYDALDVSKYYDLLKPLEIKPELLYETIDGNGNPANVYTAKDTVEKNKDYTYIVTPKADGFKVCSGNYAVSTEQNESNYVYLTASVYDVDGNSYYNAISKVDDYVVLNFAGEENVTYKGFWTTVDNKGVEITKKEFTFEKDSDLHYQKKFTTKDIAGDTTKPVDFVRVKFTVQSFIDGKYDNESSQSVSIDIFLTSYCTFTSFSASSSTGDNRGITITASGKNFTDKIKVTYYKVDDDSIQTANLQWTLLAEGGDDYTATFPVAKGYYRVCATVLKDNLYNYAAQDSYSDTVTIN